MGTEINAISAAVQSTEQIQAQPLAQEAEEKGIFETSRSESTDALGDYIDGNNLVDKANNDSIYNYVDQFARQLESGNEDEAMDAYHKLIDVLKNDERFSELNDDQIRNTAMQYMQSIIAEKKGDKDFDLETYIKDKAHSYEEKEYYLKCNMWNSDFDEYTEEVMLTEITGVEHRLEKPSWVEEHIGHNIAGFFASPYNAIFADEWH